MEQFLMGAIAMGCWVAALFFLRFWWETRDRLFAIFTAAFCLLGLTRLGLALTQSGEERHTYLYWLRLIAFVLSIFAIVDKNRPRKTREPARRPDEAAV